MHQCTNDTVPFLAQHHIRWLGNGRYSLFDNGISGMREYSRGLVYSMDEQNKTVTLLNDFRRGEPDFSRVMGSNQQLPNGNFQVGWSLNLQKNVLTEFDDSGNIVYEMKSVDTLGVISYRALKFPWKTNIFDFQFDTLKFENTVSVGDTSIKTVAVTNFSQQEIVLNSYYFTDSAFYISDNIPLTLEPGETFDLHIAFNPYEKRLYNAVLSLFHDTDTTRYGQQIRITGGGIITAVENKCLKNNIVVYPVPADKILTIKAQNDTKILNFSVYTVNGKRVLTSDNRTLYQKIKTSSFKNGVYIIKVVTGNGIYSRMFTVYHD